ncbi:enoyl-CoA-hydratase DpgB [Kitasatospora kifunensis]|uniref:Isomerase DpgB n=1 Tax=Kitasatospora kifunensis TaxID=58351 RepID=A0A7W7VSX9_KITKI|nr:enoyl-CoA-hydratase DpgB [Kitasatospora kifunensis]MBB4921119.1 isomerase DpgB [Kitasatospora kifunensis]
MKDVKSTVSTIDGQPEHEDLTLRIDGSRPLSAEAVAAVNAVCDRTEDREGQVRVIVQLSGAPQGEWAGELTVPLVSKWERALRRLERLPATIIAIADGDCGGLALDALLATDYRIATGSVRLVVPVGDGATWPGMALYRLASHGAGAAAIRRAVLFGDPIEAADALALQLIDELTDDVESALAVAAERTGAILGSELAIRRQLMFDAATVSFEEALGVHLAACDRALRRAAAKAVAVA